MVNYCRLVADAAQCFKLKTFHQSPEVASVLISAHGDQELSGAVQEDDDCKLDNQLALETFRYGNHTSFNWRQLAH